MRRFRMSNLKLAASNPSMGAGADMRAASAPPGHPYTPDYSSLNDSMRLAQPPNQAAPMSDDLTDAKIAAAEARSDTKIARLEGKMDLVLSKLDSGAALTSQSHVSLAAEIRSVKEDGRSTRANIWAAAAVVIAGIALAIGVGLAVGPWAFGFGSTLSGMVDQSVEKRLPIQRAEPVAPVNPPK